MENSIIIPEVEAVATEHKLGQNGIIQLQEAFAPHFQAFATLAKEAAGVQQDEPKKARLLRLKIRAVRIASDDARKELKADSLRRSRAIDGCHNILMHSLFPVEDGLEKIEKAEEIREAQRREALKHARTAEVMPFADPTFYDLAGMPDVQYLELLDGLKLAHAANIAAAEAAAKAEQERIRAAEAERMRIVMENARLAKIAADEREAREKAEAAAAAERAEAARLAKVEADKRDAVERARRAKEQKERQEAEAKAKAALDAERAKRQRIQAEIAAKEKAEADRISAEKAAAKRAASAPDAEKIRALADIIDGIKVPLMSNKDVENMIVTQLDKLSDWLESEARKMEA